MHLEVARRGRLPRTRCPAWPTIQVLGRCGWERVVPFEGGMARWAGISRTNDPRRRGPEHHVRLVLGAAARGKWR